MKTIILQREITKKRQDLLQKQERKFFEEIELYAEIKRQINEFLEKEKLTAKVMRQFVVEVN